MSARGHKSNVKLQWDDSDKSGAMTTPSSFWQANNRKFLQHRKILRESTGKLKMSPSYTRLFLCSEDFNP